MKKIYIIGICVILIISGIQTVALSNNKSQEILQEKIEFYFTEPNIKNQKDSSVLV